MSKERGKTMLVVGLGSPHAEDRLGWLAVDCLQELRSRAEASAELQGQVHSLSRLSAPSEYGADGDVDGQSTTLLLRNAAVPVDLLDWLRPNLELHMFDACSDVLPDDTCLRITWEQQGLQCYVESDRYRAAYDGASIQEAAGSAGGGGWQAKWPRVSLPRLRSNSSHHLELRKVLELAAELDRLPEHTWLWPLPLKLYQPQANNPDGMGPALKAWVERFYQVVLSGTSDRTANP